MSRPPKRRAAPALAAAALALACTSGDGPPSARSAVLITLDTTRYDALGLNGCAAPTSPFLDELARESLVFDRCRSVAPLTLPAHASMFTGLYPPRHGIRDNGHAALPSSAVTLAEVASEAGFRTAAFVGAIVLDRRFGLDQGFETYSQPERSAEETSQRYTERPAEEVVADALTWLAQVPPDERFLLWVHLFDAHAPYAPSEAARERVGGDPYLGEIAAMDSAIATLLGALTNAGRLEETVVLVVADHGEGRDEHGEPSHAAFCYDTTLHVPLILRYPRAHRAGERSADIASVVDVHPTLLQALGLDDRAQHDGRSLYAAAVPGDRGVYFESYYGYLNYGWSPLAGWADSQGKYIHSSAPEFFRVERDAGERSNLAGATDQLARYRDRLAEVAKRRPLDGDPEEAELGELAGELRALGYAASGGPKDGLPAPLDPSDAPSPRERTDEMVRFLRASDLADAGRCQEARPMLEAILAANPEHLIALDRLAVCLSHEKRWDDMRRVLEERLARGPEQPWTLINMGVALHNSGRQDQAIEYYRRGLALDPGHRTGRENLARLLDAKGRGEEARELREAPPSEGR